MPDTIKFKLNRLLEPKYLEKWDGKGEWNQNGRITRSARHKVRLSDKECLIKLFYTDSDRSYQPAIRVEFSVPKVIYGNNFMPLPDHKEAVRVVNDFLVSQHLLPKSNFEEGVLMRLDAFTMYPVGPLVTDYLVGLSQLNYPRRSRAVYANLDGRNNISPYCNGVEYKSSSASCTFYDKFKECRDPATAGYLRHECSLKSRRELVKLFKKDVPLVKDISSGIEQFALKRDLERLLVSECAFTDLTHAHQILVEKHGVEKGGELYSRFISLTQFPNLTNKQLAVKFGKVPHTIIRWKKGINEAGLALTVCDNGNRLPPLVPICNHQ